MKIAFFWTWDFSKNILLWILENKDIEVSLIVSQPDKPIWRKKIITATPVKEVALANNIKILQPEKLKNNQDFFDELKWLDFIVVVAYWKIVPKEVLNAPKYWCINIHWSILPKYRWASPIQESIKNWDSKTWLTIMYMSEWMDEWDILDIKEVNIDKLDTTENIFKKFEDIAPNLLINTLKWIIKWTIKWQKQDVQKATYCNKINKEDWQINFQRMSWQDIFNKYRAYFNWPGIYAYFNDKKLNLEKIDLVPIPQNFEVPVPGEVVKINKKTIWVVCPDNKIIILKQVKLEWKKSMDILSFINWNKDFLDYKF
jgi:methionyl-tRNA formyltransferase